MPRFYIDTFDQTRFVRDDEGHDCLDLDAAKRLAVDALPDMAREELPDGDERTFLAVVRGEDGGTLLHCTLQLSVRNVGAT